MDISKVVAVMAVKTNDPDKVGSFTTEDVGDGFVMSQVEEKEVEFLSEEDFEDPKRDNFENWVRSVLEKEQEDNIALHFLMEVPHED